MTDELVKRLREIDTGQRGWGYAKHAADRIEELEAEIYMLKNAGIIEVAVRNPSVSEYMNHWEARAEGADAKLAKAVEPSDGARHRIMEMGD